MANKFAVFTAAGEAVDIYDTEQDALFNAEIEGDGATVKELTENLWWIENDLVFKEIGYITVERNAAAFAETVARTGMKYTKLGELCGKSGTTVRQYACGTRNIPKLVIEKVQEIDRFLNGSR
jgi:hypothetical protein